MLYEHWQRSSSRIIQLMDGKFVAYYRVSTERQGRSGLGLDAQREAVSRHLDDGSWSLLGEFTEIESGRNNARPQLAAALTMFRLTGATLVITKLDRLARNARFLLSVMEGSGETGVVFCDLPTLPAGPVGKFLITQMAAVAELEAGLISQRTRAALAVAKARGVRLGNPSPTPATAEMAAAGRQARSRQVAARAADMLAVVRQVQAEGAGSLRAIAAELRAHGVLTPAGKVDWSPAQVQRLLKRENQSSISESH